MRFTRLHWGNDVHLDVELNPGAINSMYNTAVFYTIVLPNGVVIPMVNKVINVEQVQGNIFRLGLLENICNCADALIPMNATGQIT